MQSVRDVMTNEVLTVAADAHPAEVIRMITTHDVSALAVVGEFDVVVGVLTRTDILEAMALPEERPRTRRAWRRRAQPPQVGWHATTAGDMMTVPPVTIAPDATTAQAGRLMHRAGVNRLLVTDHRRRLLGVVAARDLLKEFGRSDEAIRADVRAALRPVAGGAVQVAVDDAVVTLTGRTPDRATVRVLSDLARSAPGVADVVTDLHVQPSAATREGAADPRPRLRETVDGWWVGRRHSRTASGASTLRSAASV